MFDEKDAEGIAGDLIAEIASEWKDRSEAYHVEKDGKHFFVFTLQPSRVIRYAHVVERPASDSIFHFNPLAEATEIVMSCAFKIENSVDASMREDLIRMHAKTYIKQMLTSAPDVFRDAMWQARIVAETLCSLETMQTFGRPDIARGLVNSAVAMIEEKARDGFGRISKARKPKINQFSIHTALRMSLDDFKRDGTIPSQRRFAKAVGVTAKGWRDFLKKRKLGVHDSTVRQWLEELLASDQRREERMGTIYKGDNPRGD